jgi:hypothetical protein
VCREPTSKGEKSRQSAGYVAAEVVEESRNIRGRLRVGECARTGAASISAVISMRLPASY